MKSSQNRVFLSYAREDIGQAKKLYNYLTETGISVWFDENSVNVGEKWIPTIQKEISRAKFFIALLSSISVQKQGFVQKEIELAINIQKIKSLGEIFILPVRLDNCKIPSNLYTISPVDLFPDWENGFRKLIRTIVKPMPQENLEIIGFDLGHGESAVAVTRLASSSEPQAVDILNGKKSIITAVSIDEGKILIGDDAYCVENLDNLSILFKSYRLNDPKVYEPVKLFVQKCLEILRRNGKIKLDENTYFWVGSPAGWTQNDRKEYEKILQEAGMKNIFVKAESRAAFLDAKESGSLNQSFNRLADSVLIIDIGSSTTDFTIVRNYKERLLDEGHNNLGSGLLDQQIFKRVLNKKTIKEKKELTDLFAKHPSFQAKCLLKCREVKETYFSKADENDWVNSAVTAVELIPLQDKNLYFEIRLYKKDMEEILKSPIIELDNKSLPESFHETLIKIQKSEEFQTPKLVLMTGGGSRMRFTYEICHKIFPQTEIRVGLEPALTIAKGLALLGRTDFKIKAFRSEVDEFIESQELHNTVINQFPELFEAISNNLIEKFLEIGKNNFNQWANGKIDTVSDMERKIQLDTENFLRTEGNDYFKKQVNLWLKDLGAKIESMTGYICDKYRIDRTTFSLFLKASNPYVTVPKPECQQIMIETAQSIVGVVVAVFSIILAIILGGFGLIGWLIGIFLGVLSTVGAFLGTEELGREKLKNLSIPISIRSILYSEEQMDQAIESKRPEFEEKIRLALEKEFQSSNKLKEVFESIKLALNKSADQACVFIE